MSIIVEVYPVRGDSQPIFITQTYGAFVPQYVTLFADGAQCPDSKVSIHKSDTPVWLFQLKEQIEGFWQPVDITGATIKFAAQGVTDATPPGGAVFEKSAVIEDAAEGKFKVTLIAADTDDVGIYGTELEITWTGGEKRSLKGFALYINEDIVE